MLDVKKAYKFIDSSLQEIADPVKASQMEAYMKHKFKMFGVPSPARKEVVKSFRQQFSYTADEDFKNLVAKLWDAPQREMQYFAMSLMDRVTKKMDLSWLDFLSDLVVKKSWWDTVDFISSHLIGKYIQLFLIAYNKS